MANVNQLYGEVQRLVNEIRTIRLADRRRIVDTLRELLADREELREAFAKTQGDVKKFKGRVKKCEVAIGRALAETRADTIDLLFKQLDQVNKRLEQLEHSIQVLARSVHGR